jgi:hypothetical protein
MSRKFYRLSNAEFTIFTTNLLIEINKNKAVLGYKQADVDGLEGDNTEQKTELLERQSIQDSLNAKNVSVKARRTKMNKMVAKMQTDAENNDDVSDSLLETLGFDAREGNAAAQPLNPPKELSVSGSSDGVNRLKFNRNGNKQGTLFYIYAKTGDAGEAVLIEVITGTKYDHKNQTPGIKVQYFVKAKRGEEESAASNTAIVYP